MLWCLIDSDRCARWVEPKLQSFWCLLWWWKRLIWRSWDRRIFSIAAFFHPLLPRQARASTLCNARLWLNLVRTQHELSSTRPEWRICGNCACQCNCSARCSDGRSLWHTYCTCHSVWRRRLPTCHKLRTWKLSCDVLCLDRRHVTSQSISVALVLKLINLNVFNLPLIRDQHRSLSPRSQTWTQRATSWCERCLSKREQLCSRALRSPARRRSQSILVRRRKEAMWSFALDCMASPTHSSLLAFSVSKAAPATVIPVISVAHQLPLGSLGRFNKCQRFLLFRLLW